MMMMSEYIAQAIKMGANEKAINKIGHVVSRMSPRNLDTWASARNIDLVSMEGQADFYEWLDKYID